MFLRTKVLPPHSLKLVKDGNAEDMSRVQCQVILDSWAFLLLTD